jgi:hypothetical protein
MRTNAAQSLHMLENSVNYEICQFAEQLRKQCRANAAQILHMLENTVNYKVFKLRKNTETMRTNAAQSLYMLENTVNHTVFEIAETMRNKCCP